MVRSVSCIGYMIIFLIVYAHSTVNGQQSGSRVEYGRTVLKNEQLRARFRALPRKTWGVLPLRKKNNNPDAPLISHMPEAAHHTSFPSPQKIGINVTAGTYTDMPDSTQPEPGAVGAAGPSQIIIFPNSGLRAFSKATGEDDRVLEVQGVSVFQPIEFDSRIRFDQFTNRWFLFAISTPQGASFPTNLNIAVSDSGTITPCTQWQIFSLQADEITPPGDTGLVIDFPQVGIDKHAIYIGINIFNPITGDFVNSTLFVVEKSSLIAGSPFITAFRNVIDFKTQQGMFSPIGVDNFDENPRFGHFIGIDHFTNGLLILQRVINPGSTDPLNPPTLSKKIPINVPNYQSAYNFSAPNKGNLFGVNGFLATIDPRLFMGHIRDNQLYTTHTIPVNKDGLSGTGNEDRDAIRWYQFTLTPHGNERRNTVPVLVQFGNLFDSERTKNPIYFFMPAIMTNKKGDLTIAYNTAGHNQFVHAQVAGRKKTDPLGMLGTPIITFKSTTSYNAFIQAGHGTIPGPITTAAQRWGDTPYTSLDPSDELTMWAIQEVVKDTDIWGLQIVQILPAP